MIDETSVRAASSDVSRTWPVATARGARAAAEAGEHAALDRPERDAEALGELRLREAAVVGELEGLPLIAGELGQRRLHRGAPVSQHRILVDRADGRLGSDFQWLAAPALLPAHEVDGPPVHDGEDPGRRLRPLSLVGIGRAPDGEKGFLDRVLGERAVAQDPEGESEGEAAEAVVQHAEGVVVAAADGLEHLLVGRLPSRLGLLPADGG